MKALVIYDSQFGNTAQVARAIADGLRSAGAAGVEVVLQKASEARPEHLAGATLVIVGSPTQKFRPTSAIKRWLKRLPKDALAGVHVAAFDTRFTEEMINTHRVLTRFVAIFGYAAEPILEALRKKGGRVAAPAEGFYVSDTQGPLVEGEIARATEWACQVRTRVQEAKR
ncbi:MAG: flavodoxin family protein [Caldilineales bacterium]|nr:flavodoxin family protein [Caldilineales bacterium]MDW8318796.1 flavodoxin family protein [Anaerolineae bacterium]